MRPEEVARRHAHREGYRLIAFNPVALPVWQVTVRVHVEDRTELPILSEYVMLAVASGFNDPTNVAAFLGLDEKTTRRTLLELLETDDVIVTAPLPGAQHHLRLTPKGDAVLRDAVSVVPHDVPVQFAVDGLTGTIDVWRGGALSPHQVTQSDLLEIPHPRQRPEVEDFPLTKLDELIGSQGRGNRTVIDVIEVERRKRFFLESGVALVFRPDSGGETEVEIAVDGKLSENHSQGFRRLQSRKRRPILEIDAAQGPLDLLTEIAPQGVAAVRSSEAEARTLLEQRDRAIDRQTSVTTTAEQVIERSTTSRLKSENEALQAKITEIQSSLQQIPFRLLEVHEHRPLLLDALATSQSRLLIISPWVTTSAVDQELLRGMKAALERGVTVYVGYGLDDRRGPGRDNSGAVASIEQLAASHNTFRLERFGDTHAKVLVCDNRYAVVTSFNWLSFRGDPNRTYRDERGALIAAPTEVDAIFHKMRMRFAGEAQTAPPPEPRSLEEILKPGHERSPVEDLRRLIAAGESQDLELKETARWNVRAGKETPEIRDAVVKTVAAFLNSGGGTLVIGVDDGGMPTGIDRDLAAFKGRGIDAFENWLMGSLLRDRLSGTAVAGVTCTFVNLDNLVVCRLDVPPSETEVFAKVDKADEAFFVRVGNSTHQLSMQETLQYVRENFGNRDH